MIGSRQGERAGPHEPAAPPPSFTSLFRDEMSVRMKRLGRRCHGTGATTQNALRESMAAPHTPDDFWTLLRQSALVDQAGLKKLIAAAGPWCKSAAEAAQNLVQKELLTPFQAQMLLQGKARGLRVGDFRLLSQLPADEPSNRFLASSVQYEQYAVVTMLPRGSEAMSGAMRQRLTSLTQLRHPLLIRVLQLLHISSADLLVHEWEEGTTLAQQLAQEGPLPVAAAVTAIQHAGAALDYLHTQQVPHGAVNPDHLLLDANGQVKLQGLGLGWFKGGGQARPFKAPEQLQPQPRLDLRSDQYGLGATLYALLTGRPPRRDLPPLTQQRPDVTPELEEVIARMLAPAPEQRFATLAEALAELEQALAPAVTSTRRGRVPQSAGRSRTDARPLAPESRRRLLQAIAVGLSLVAVTALVIVLLVSSNSPDTLAPVTRANDAADDWKQFPLTANADSVTLVHGQNRALAATMDGSVNAFHPDQSAPTTDISSGGVALRAVAIGRDGRTLALGGEDGYAAVWDFSQRAVRCTLPNHRGTVFGVDVFSDEGLVCTGDSGGKVRLFKLTGNQAQLLWEHEHGRQIWCVRFSNDGKSIVSASAGPTSGGDDDLPLVQVLDPKTGQVKQSFFGHRRDVRRVAFSPNGRRLVTGSFDGTVRIWNVQTGEETRTIDAARGGYVEGVVFVGEGNQVASCTSNSGDVVLWNADSGAEVRRLRGHANKVGALCVSSDGQILISAGVDRTLRYWRLQR
ncbi:MAG TPA: WD40 repeat domain-containing serine/threonine-protein kinase [Gemmatales bacterium]|nr:WD40 repeat domain-containing serine/threonine-protein kinase [Gemmatales bacterium]HMP58524.1 WD40 repeat domain-containing serine/threonine-protein kinase [Gemmatales bacterium]